jgi:hypothetical protein
MRLCPSADGEHGLQEFPHQKTGMKDTLVSAPLYRQMDIDSKK